MANLATITNNLLADSGVDPLSVVVTSGSYSNPAWITALSWAKISGTPTTLAGYGITNGVPTSRTLTINGVSQDLSADRTWTITAGVSSVSAGTGISVNQTTGAVTVTNTGTLTVAGTTNQVLVNGGTAAANGNITLSLPQSIATSSSPTFNRIYTSGLYGPSTSGNIPIWQYDSNNPGYGIMYYETANDYLKIDVSGNLVTGTPDFQVSPDTAYVNGYTVLHAGNYSSYAFPATGGQLNGYLTVSANWGASPYTSALTIIGTYPSITFRGSNSNWEHLQHVDSSGNFNFYGGAGYTDNNWNQFGQITTSGTISWLYSISAPTFYMNSNLVATQSWVNSQGFVTGGPYLPLAGGTVTGSTTFTSGLYSRKSQTAGNYTTSALWTESYSATATGIAFHISGYIGNMLYMNTDGSFYWTGTNMYINNTQVVTNSGTWGISISGTAANASALNNWAYTSYAYRASGTGYYQVNDWVQMNGNFGIYWPSYYGLHLYPNQSSYGALQINGSKNGWSGIYFNDSGNTLMMNAAESGHYNVSYGWQFRWYVGYLYVSRSTYGGGTEYTVLDSGNYNSYAPTLTGGGASGTWGINVTGSAGSSPTLSLTSLGTGSVNVNYGTTYVLRNENGNGAVLSYAPVLHIGGGDTMWQMQGSYGTSGNGTLYFRQGYNGSWGTWLTMLSSANYSSYALPLSGGTMSGSINMGGNNISNINSVSSTNFTVGNAVYFGGGNNYFNWTNSRIYSNVGIESASTIYSYAYRGNGNVAGTGEATYHPAGIYSTGTNWLYGTLYLNGNNIRDVGGIAQNSIMGRPNAQWGAGGTTTGAVVIKFPGGTGNYGMVHAVIDIYEYSGNNVTTVIVGGHNWGGQWYNFGANVVGYTDKSVRVGVKDGQYCIVIGNGSSSWSYGQVVLRKIQNGAYYLGVMDVGAGYTIQIESDSYSWISGDLRMFRSSGNIYMNESLVATQSWVSSSFVPSRSQSNWNDGTVLGNVVGMLSWKNYGNGHVIFDASAGTSPSGGGVSQTNATYAWTASYPTLMGWNGSQTYGVRVDSARVADSATSAGYLTGGDSAAYMLLYNVLTGDLNTYNSPGLYSAEYTGSTNRPVGKGGHFIQISDAGGTDVKTQWYYAYDSTGIYMRLMWGNGSWGAWRTLITDYNIGSQSVSYASTAGSATNLYGAGASYIQSSSTGTSYTANYQVRENVGGGGNTNEVYAPQLAFHWSGVVASSIMMEASGRIAIRNNPGTGYENFAAAAIYTNDWFYVNGSNGIYWNSYGGGWRMQNSSYIEMYGSKSLNMNGGSVDYVSSIYMNGGVYINTFNNRNLLVKSTGSSDCGILGRGSGDQFAFQLYGSGGDYGFLNSAWGAWDIRKTVNGALYMNDNTSYYLYTNSSSYSAVMNGTIRLDSGAFGTNSRSGSSQASISRTFAPQGASNGWNNGGVNAAIKIRLPFRGNDCMWSMKVRIYNYANDSVSEYTIGNYSYSAGAYHRAAYFIGGTNATPYTVRFGNDGSYDCVWIGETGTYWSYPQVSVMDFQGGYVRCSVQETANNWDISFVTSFNTVADSITPSVRFSNIYAPYYYDVADSTYYTKPSSTSYMHTIGSFYLQNNYDVSVDHPYGIYFSSGRSTAYAIYRESGAWNYPYPDLRIAFHTGISIGANAGYGGVRFFTDYDMSSVVLYVNNSSYGGGGNVYATGSITASAFYEISDARTKTILEENHRVQGIELIKPKLYTKNGKTELGYIAQEFIEKMPYALTQDGEEKYYSLIYREVHTAKIAYLEDSIEEIKAKILYLENQLKNKNNENN